MARTNHLRGLVVLAVAALAASLLLVVAGKPAQASFPGLNNDLIAFTSDLGSTKDPNTGVVTLNDDIYVTNERGAEPIRLTNDAAGR